MAQMGLRYSRAGLEQYMGVSKNKATAWIKGQRPSADDLQKFVELFGFSAHWLLTNKGEPLQDDQAAVRETRAKYQSKYLDERERAIEARDHASRLKAELVDQQERILRSVSRELVSEGVSERIIYRVHAAVMDYKSQGHDHQGRPITEPGDPGARIPQPEK